jgi:hypothetical protein
MGLEKVEWTINTKEQYEPVIEFGGTTFKNFSQRCGKTGVFQRWGKIMEYSLFR